MNRIMGLDVGDKTIGVAVSDPLGFTAQGVTTIKRVGIKIDLEVLEVIMNEYNINKVIVGFPKNMNNTIGPQGKKVLKFVKKMENKFKMDIILQDERLTTVSAERVLLEGDLSRKKRKEIIDKVAATYILQAYLDKN